MEEEHYWKKLAAGTYAFDSHGRPFLVKPEKIREGFPGMKSDTLIEIDGAPLKDSKILM